MITFAFINKQAHKESSYENRTSSNPCEQNLWDERKYPPLEVLQSKLREAGVRTE